MAKKIKKPKTEVNLDISKQSKDLQIVRKKYNQYGSLHPVFDKISEELKINSDTEKGRRVLTAFYPDSHDVFFVTYYNVGEKHFPHGGIKVYNKTIDEYKYFYPDAVVKHKNVEFYTRIFED